MKLDRLLIESVEGRILVGLVAFVATMVVVGWVAINEPARMEAFDQQFNGRSVERGGKMFNQNCSTCHGVDGRGQLGVAPGLNSPHLFGHSFTEALDDQIATLERELENAETAEAEQEIQTELTALQTERDGIVAQMQPAIDAGYTPETPDRMTQVAWEGTTRSYIYTTLVHGRPGSNSYWPGGMAAWGQTAGGPLRDDQLEDLTNYIMNWDKGDAWTIDDLNAVNQYSKLPADPALVAAAPADDAELVGTDVDAILTELEGHTGDPVNGQVLYTTYACIGCHNGVVAPATEEQWLDAVAGADGRPSADNPERYIVESIVLPNEYVVNGYNAGAMPLNFGERMSYQDMADVLAYISSFDG